MGNTDNTYKQYGLRKGSFLYKIDRRGGGPGEYRKLTNISIDHDQNNLLLHCGSMQQIHSFDLEGNYKSTVDLNFNASAFTYVGKGFSAFYCQYTRNYDLEMNNYFPNLIITKGENFDISQQKMYFPDSYAASGAITMLPPPFSKADESRTAMIAIYNDTIYHLNVNELNHAYYFDFGKSKKDRDFYDLLENKEPRLNQLLKYLAENEICNIVTFLETTDQIFFSYRRQSNFHFAYYVKSSNELIDVFQTLDNLRMNKLPFHNDMDG